MGIIRPGVKYQPSNPAAGIDILLIIFWTFFILNFYSLDIIPTIIKEAIALVTLFFVVWCMWEVLHDMGIKIIALIIAAFIISMIGILNKDNWILMTALTTGLSFVLNFENTRLLVKKMGITIKYSERNRQTVVLAQCGVFIVNIFLTLAITISDAITSLLHKPFIFWVYDLLNQYVYERSAQDIDYHSFFWIGMDRIVIILMPLVIFILIRMLKYLLIRMLKYRQNAQQNTQLDKFLEKAKIFITANFD